MSINELRTELLAQHDELRELVAILREAAQRVPPRVDDLRTLLATLAADVRTHNAFEEAVLHPILPTADAWGELRDHLVDEHHRAEHLAIATAIVATHEVVDPVQLAARTLEVTTDLMRHLVDEEREMLAADVLRDDLITSGVDG